MITHFLHSDSAITLLGRYANFPRNSSIGGVWNVKLGYCKKQPLKQIYFFKKVYKQSYWELWTICLKAAFL